jgi:hypothetical protein
MPVHYRSHRQTALAVCGQVGIAHNAAGADHHNRQRRSPQLGSP